MALANIARWFQSQGLRVIMVDWDLEAPGLESFFGADADEKQALRGKLGLLEQLTAYKDIFSSLPSIPPPVPPTPASISAAPARAAQNPAGGRLDAVVAMLQDILPPLSHFLVPIKFPSGDGDSAGKLLLLPAGSRAGDRFSRYAETVQSFDWSEFYQKYEGEAYFEWMRRQLTDPKLADIVLIDSRTGVAEMSGVCTRQLADVVVTLCAPNDQNLDGVEMMARSFTRPDLLEARGGRPLRLVLTPSRVDISDGRVVDLFEERFRQKLMPFVPQPLLRLGLGFDKLRIPYIKEYAYSERLAIGDPEGVRGLQDAYITLAAHIAFLAPADSALRRQCRETLQRIFGLPTVYIGFLEPGDASFARDLDSRLQQAGAITIIQEDGLVPTSVPAVGSRLGALVLAVGADGLCQERAAATWWFARQNGICLYFAAAVDPGRIERPLWASRIRLYDAVKEWDELVRLVETPCQAKRIPLMAPAAANPVLGREDEIGKAKALLFNGSPAVALLGPGGAGKTAVAQALCHDPDVVDGFDGGILWASLGAQPNLPSALGAMLAALTGDAAPAGTLEETARKLAEALYGRRCLIVCDDAADAGQLQYFPRTQMSCILLTTRFRSLAAELNADTVEIGPLSPDAALEILLAGLEVPDSLAASAAGLARLLGNVPLALQVANKALRSRGGTHEEVAAGLEELLSAISGEGLEALESAGTTVVGPSLSLLSAFSAALERLDSRERALLPLLASLPADTPVSFGSAAEVLGVDLSEAERLLRRLASMSIIELGQNERAFRVPALAREYFRSLGQRQKRVESSRRPSSARSKIFVSYLRSDTASTAGRIYDRLSAEFGLDRIFMDIDSILPGEDFVSVIQRQIDSSLVILVLIGRQWTALLGESGNWVGLELVHALQRSLPVIPLLVDGARFPESSELPADLAPLTRRQALVIDNLSFHQDLDRLMDVIRRLENVFQPTVPRSSAGPTPAAAPMPSLPTDATGPASMLPAAAPAPRRRSRWWAAGTTIAGAAAAVLLVGLGVGMWRSAPHGQPPRPSPVSPVNQASGEVRDLFDRAEQYYYGRGVQQDYAQARALYLRCAGLGFAPAMNNLGRMYELGQGVPEDLTQAVRWYAKAAQAGNPDAQVGLNTLAKARGWAVLIATDTDIERAKPELAKAQRLKSASPVVYLLNGKYLTTVGTYSSRDIAEKEAIAIRPKTRADAMPLNLTSDCPYSTTRVQNGLPVIVCAKP
jgi:hypothetical protein